VDATQHDPRGHLVVDRLPVIDLEACEVLVRANAIEVKAEYGMTA
jgi:hypothetical protein